MDHVTFKIAETAADFEAGKKLFEEYAASLYFDLGFQDFKKELAAISTQYKTPEGALLIGVNNNHEALGCAGIRKLSDGTAELKRLYVKPAFRSLKIGKRLLVLAIETATKLNYQYLRLDTVPGQEKAQDLYYHLGFYKIDPYRHNPIEGTIYMEKKLSGGEMND